MNIQHKPVLMRATGLAVRRGVPVLVDVDLTLRQGEVLGLVGANGGGKSSLMALLTGELQPDKGTMELAGEPYAPRSRDEGRALGVGFVRQRLDLDPSLTVAQAIYRHTQYADAPAEELQEMAAKELAGCGIDLEASRPIGQLDHAQRGLVEVVRMFVEDVRVVVLDEIAATFNVAEIVALHVLVRVMVARGRSVIYVSHRLNEVVALCDRVAVLRGGEVTVELNPRHVTLRDLAEEMLEYAPGEPANRDGHMSGEVALHVEGLTAEPLTDVSFDLRRGEVLGVIGNRRSGMSQLGRALVGAIPATVKHAALFGREVELTKQGAEDRRIAFLGAHHEELGIDADEIVADSLTTPSAESDERTFGTEIAERRAAVAAFRELGLRTTGITQKATVLSGGDFAKLALQRWANSDTDILVIEQPSRGLDAGARAGVFNMLAAHTSAGRAAIILSTEVDELLEWCDRVAFLDAGRIVRIAPVAELDETELVRAMVTDERDVADGLAIVRSGSESGDDDPHPGH